MRLLCRALLCRSLLFLLLATLPATLLAAPEPVRVHVPESGLPPFLFLTPGNARPVGIVAELVEAAARNLARPVRYEFLPREQAGEALQRQHADLAMFFTVTRPPQAGLQVSTPILASASLLITLRGKPLRYQRTADLRDVPLCLLTDETHPSLALLAMNGQLVQRRAKTEQAQLMMLRNGDCAAAVLNSPVWSWLQTRYGNDDLQSDLPALITESTVLGFRRGEDALAGQVNAVLARWRTTGELDRVVRRYLPDGDRLGLR